MSDEPEDPRAGLSQFGNQDPLTMSVADLRGHAGYLQASGALADSAAYARAADLLDPQGGIISALELLADEIFKEMDSNLKAGTDGPNEKLSAWRTILIQAVEGLRR